MDDCFLSLRCWVALDMRSCVCVCHGHFSVHSFYIVPVDSLGSVNWALNHRLALFMTRSDRCKLVFHSSQHQPVVSS